MKLFDSTNLNYILFSVITYITIGAAFYLVMDRVIYQDVEERLRVERKDFENFVEAHGLWEESCYFVENKIDLTPITHAKKNFPAFKDTLMFNRYNHEYVPFREYSFVSTIGDTPYKVSIRKSLIESKKLLKSITITMLVFLCLGILLLFIFQRRIARRIWRPFYKTLTKAKVFELHEGKGLTLPHEKVYEFNELNSVLNKMTDKISRDYTSLKEFTENSSHEIQTPLALINSRVEELIQQKNFSLEQMNWIQDIHQSSLRLSKLHQALLLLSKIDNGQFFEFEIIDFSAVIRQKMSELEEFIAHKNLNVHFSTDDSFHIKMNASLGEALIINLLNNAIKHNYDGGQITITIKNNTLEFANTGASLTTDPERFFERFKKQNQASGSLGLGLAIVKKICDNYGLSIHYRFDHDKHILTIDKASKD